MSRKLATILAALLLTFAAALLPPIDATHGYGPPGTATAEAHGAKYPWQYYRCRVIQSAMRERHTEINVSTGATRTHDVWSVFNCAFCGIAPDTVCRKK